MRRFPSTIGVPLAVLALATSCAVPEDDTTETVTGEATVPSSFADTGVASAGAPATTMSFAPDGKLFVCRQDGHLQLIKGTTVSTFLSLPVDNQFERGLLGVAIDPNWATDKWVYVYYTVVDSSTASHNRVARYKASASNPDVADTSTRQILLELPKLGAVYHNGGALNFGHDGKLYIAVGDNKTGSPARSTTSLLGKILRINKDGTIPTDNPFYASTTGNFRAIWQKGLRNPFTFAFDPVSGRMHINDVGESTYEEINVGGKGTDYGWPDTEGTSGTGITGPFYRYGSRDSIGGRASCAIIGATFYDPVSPKFPADYVGDYFFADFCNYTIRRIDVSTKTVSSFASGVTSPVDLRTGPDGALYYLQRSGAVRKISYTGTSNVAPYIINQPVSKTVAPGQSVTFSVTAGGSATLTYQWYRSGTAISGATSASYTHAATTSDNGIHYKVIVKNAFGSATSTDAILTVTSDQPPTAKITLPAAGTTYKGGQTINYAGTGTDPEDGTLTGAAFTWQVDFHHDTHIHPFIPATTGSTSGSFTVPVDNEVSPNVWYRILLTVKDKNGLTGSTQLDVMPVKQSFTVTSNPGGLQLELDDQPFTAPKTVLGVVGISRKLGVVSPQTLNGITYSFVSWSDGGAISHTISTPATATTYTATFKQSTTKIYEAESAVLSGPVVANTKTGFTGTGYADYINASADYVEFTVNAASAGTFPLTFRYANASTTSRPMAITVNGKTVNASLDFPPTGDWTIWKTVSVSAPLVAGSNKVRATAIGSSGPNLDHLEAP
jgi:glucose/arabinose dehydrogenase